MEKRVTVAGTDVTFKTSGIALLVYSNQTGRDLICDLLRMYDQESQAFDLKGFQSTVLFDICWTLARVANPTIPPPMEWLDSFEAFPVVDVFVEIQDLFMHCISARVLPKNLPAAANCLKNGNRITQRP